MNSMRSVIVALAGACAAVPGWAQAVPPPAAAAAAASARTAVEVAAVPGQIVPLEDGLQQLVDEALEANLELRASGLSVQQRLAALEQARARYLPVIDFAARYSRGRRRPHHRDPGRRPASTRLRDARPAAGGAGPAAAVPARPATSRSNCCATTSRRRSSCSRSRCTSRASGRPSTPIARRSLAPRPTSPRCARRSSAT